MDADTITEIRKALGTPQLHELGEERAFVTLPADYRLEDVSKLLPPPERPQQRVALTTVESFVTYVNRYRTESTAVFADETVGKFEAVLDYHGAPVQRGLALPPGRGHQDHLAYYDAPHSVEWKAWAARDGQWMTQLDFAQLIESRLTDVVTPAPADLMQLALELQVHKAAEFRSEQVLQTGQTRFRYEETISGSSRGGELAIPKAFTILVPVFTGEKPQPVELLFRFRLQDAKLSLSYQIQRREQLVAQAALQVSESIRAGLHADVQFYRGTRA